MLFRSKKTITVPWNYAAKLEEINNIIEQGGGTKKYDFKTYIGEIWDDCIKNSDRCLKVADKPARKAK